MLQSMELQKAGHDLVPEPLNYKNDMFSDILFFFFFYPFFNLCSLCFLVFEDSIEVSSEILSSDISSTTASPSDIHFSNKPF